MITRVGVCQYLGQSVVHDIFEGKKQQMAIPNRQSEGFMILSSIIHLRRPQLNYNFGLRLVFLLFLFNQNNRQYRCSDRARIRQRR